MNNPLAWSPAQRCLAASGINVVFALLYLAVYAHAAWFPEANPEVSQSFLPTATWVVALTGCGMSLLSWISFRRRHRPEACPWLTITTITLCTWVVIFSTYFYGLFTHLYAGVAIVAAWVVGLTLFSAREMWVNLLSTLFCNSLLLADCPNAMFLLLTKQKLSWD